MANLQSSGAISIEDIKNLFGGPASPSLSNYYRGGSYIPATRAVNTLVREPTRGGYYSSYVAGSYAYAYAYAWLDGGGASAPDLNYSPNWSSAYWNGIEVFNSLPSSTDSYTTGGYTYYQGSYIEYFPSIAYAYETWAYGIYRTSGTESTVSINTGIPSSGQISLSQFYGAEKP